MPASAILLLLLGKIKYCCEIWIEKKYDNRFKNNKHCMVVLFTFNQKYKFSNEDAMQDLIKSMLAKINNNPHNK